MATPKEIDDLMNRLNSADPDIAAAAERELLSKCAKDGRNPLDVYVAESLRVAKEQKIMKNQDGNSRTDDGRPTPLGDRWLAGVEKAADSDDADDVTRDADEQDDERDDEDTMTPAERKRHGFAARKSHVSFASPLFPKNESREFPLESQPQTRQMPDESEEDETDALGRSYGSAVMDRLAGAWSSTRGEVDPVPSAGAGPTREHDARGVPNSDFRPMPSGEGDAGHSAGADGHGTHPARVNQGRPDAYSVESEDGEPGRTVLRMGDGWLLPSMDGGGGVASQFIPPSPSRAVSKSEVTPGARPKGFFRHVGGKDLVSE